MILPTLNSIAHEPIVDKDGKMADGFRTMMQLLLKNLQLYLHDEGYLFPKLTQTQIDTINNAHPDDQKVYIARVVHNTTTNRMMVNNTGTFVNLAV